MKLFITGASGFIGSHLTNLAKRKGYEIIALKKGYLDPQNYGNNIEWLNKDLLEIRNYESDIIQKCNSIILIVEPGKVSLKNLNLINKNNNSSNNNT